MSICFFLICQLICLSNVHAFIWFDKISSVKKSSDNELRLTGILRIYWEIPLTGFIGSGGIPIQTLPAYTAFSNVNRFLMF